MTSGAGWSNSRLNEDHTESPVLKKVKKVTWQEDTEEDTEVEVTNFAGISESSAS